MVGILKNIAPYQAEQHAQKATFPSKRRIEASNTAGKVPHNTAATALSRFLVRPWPIAVSRASIVGTVGVPRLLNVKTFYDFLARVRIAFALCKLIRRTHIGLLHSIHP